MELSNIVIKNNISDEEMRKTLVSCVAFDHDFSGKNGPEYTSKNALDAGYESDAEYYADFVIKTFKGSRIVQVEEYLEYFFKKNKHYYIDYVIDVLLVDGKIVACFGWR